MMNISKIWCPVFRSVGLLTPKEYEMILFSNLLAMSITDVNVIIEMCSVQ